MTKYVVVKSFDQKQALQMLQANDYNPLQDYIFDALMDTGKVTEEAALKETKARIAQLRQVFSKDWDRMLGDLANVVRNPTNLVKLQSVRGDKIQVGDVVMHPYYRMLFKVDSNEGSKVSGKALSDGKPTSLTLFSNKEYEVVR
jgi:hypothetical protein